MVRFDHQINASNTWGVRWLRELSPQRNQAIADRRPVPDRRQRFGKRTTKTRRSWAR